MKILQVIPTLEAGGAEGFITNLSVSLSDLGIDVKLFLMAGVREERGDVLFSRLKKAGIEVIGSGEHNVRSPINILELARLICSWKPDIVQANMYQTEVLVSLSRILTRGCGTCYVRRLANSNICGRRSTVIMKLMDRFFKLTIACSPVVADAYKIFMRWKYKSELISIPNGGLLKEIVTKSEERDLAREEIQLPGDAFVVLHIGRIDGLTLSTGQKAHDVLLKAFAMAFGNNKDCILVMVGDGPLRHEAEALARDLGLSAQVRFLGKQPEPWPALNAADIFFFPSRFEGMPNVLPEAVSCGLPILASDIPEIKSLSPGDAWILKPVDDVEAFAYGLSEIYSNIELYQQRASNAAKGITARFSMGACAERYIQAYKNILMKNAS